MKNTRMIGRLCCIALALAGVLLLPAKVPADANFMMYMLGGDLEEDSEAATRDILELLRAEIPEDVHVYVLAGGAEKWSLSQAQDGGVTIFGIRDRTMQVISTKSTGSCATAESLSAFLGLCNEHTPAEENVLILWGHGMPEEKDPGIGYDTLFEEDVLTLEEICEGIKTGGVFIDVLGLDACSMASDDIADSLSDACGHLLAVSGEIPLQGWPYQQLPSLLTGDAQTDCDAVLDVVNRQITRAGNGIRLEKLF